MIKRCYVDTETTGLTEKNAIVQLAMMVEHDDQIVDSIALEIAPFPDDEISDDALRVSGRTREQVVAYEPPGKAHKKVMQFLEHHVDKFNKSDKLHFLAYNASFDVMMLRAWFKKNGNGYFGSYFWTPAIDIMSIAADWAARDRADATKFPNFKLATVCKALGVPLAEAHDAIADITAAREVYLKTRRSA